MQSRRDYTSSPRKEFIIPVSGTDEGQFLTLCRSHFSRNGSNGRASFTSGLCLPATIASTISGASGVSRSTRGMWGGAMFALNEFGDGGKNYPA